MYPDYNIYNQYYGFGGYDQNLMNYRSYPEPTKNEEIITLAEAIELIRKSVADEKQDVMFYENLIAQAPEGDAKDILTSIRNDEAKHNQYLRNLYYKLTGQMLPQDTSMQSKTEEIAYKDGLKKALFAETDAVIKYRRILAAMPDNESKTIIIAIMTDELRHANKYNYLIHEAGSKN